MITHTLYKEKTLNETDQKYFDIALMALRHSEYFESFELLEWMYVVAFSCTDAVASVIDIETSTPESVLNDITGGTADQALLNTVAPTLYGGSDIGGAIKGITGEPAECVTVGNLISGDAIIRLKNGKCDLFVYSNRGLYCITAKCTEADLDEVLASLTTSEKYVILRPSVNLNNFTPSALDEMPPEMTERQRAVVATAYTYLLRGEWLQYQTDTTTMNLTPEYNETRSQLGCKAPEDYSSTDWGYVNCAPFAYDVYWQTFGKKLPGTLYCTKGLYEDSESMNVYSFYTDASKIYTDEEKAAVEADLLSNLEPGDIIVIRRRNSTGHAMLYVGNGQIIQSNGLSLIYESEDGYAKENREPTVRFQKIKDYLFGIEGAPLSSYMFTDPAAPRALTGVVIVRPLADASFQNIPLPETTRARMRTAGLVIEKRASVKPCVSVNPGDDITYTITLNNTCTDDITVEVFDAVPNNTSYVSGGDRRDGDSLYWTVTVPACKTASVSYTVKVAENMMGATIQNKDATVEGISIKYSDIHIKRTLTKTEQSRLIAAFNQLKSEDTKLQELLLVNELYKRVLGVDKVFEDTDFLTVAEGDQGIFTSKNIPRHDSIDVFARNEPGKYYKMLVPTLFGGRYLRSEVKNEWIRTRVAWEYNLVVGDMILGKNNMGIEIYMYIGDGVLINLSSLEKDNVDIQSRLDRLLGYKYYFAIVRPSFIIG